MHLMKVKNMISKISFNVPKINFSNTNATSKNTLERSPKTDTVSFSGNCECPACNNELPEGLKETLDNKVFTFKKDNGEEFVGTIKEYLNDSILSWDDNRMYAAKSGVIHSTMFENAMEMLNKGLDYSKNYRVQAGPGTYFAGYQDMTYGKVALRGTYVGEQEEIPVFESKFYDGIMYCDELKQTVKDFAGEEEITNKTYKLVNKYCHDLLVDEMGIDILYCAMGMNSCYVALNDDKMSLRPYNFKVVNGQLRWL